jgi:hypothetical protein
VYPSGLNKTATDDEVNVSFRPTPNYAALAEAAAGSGEDADASGHWMKGARVKTVAQLKDALREATRRVGEEQKGMLIEVLM